MTKYVAWNSCFNLPSRAFNTLAEAQAFTTPKGGPNRITSSPDGEEWILGAYADRAAQWSGPYAVCVLSFEPRRPGDAMHDYVRPNTESPE